MSEPYIGQINTFAFNFAPRGWSFCNGAILSIAQYTALFSLLGTTYGGNGTTTFALPNLQSRFPMCMGQGPGLSNRTIGEIAGSQTVTLTVANLPAHNHPEQISATTSNSTSDTPSNGAYLAKGADSQGGGASIYYSGATPPLVNLAAGNTGLTGGNQPIGIMNPYLVLNFCIALEGIFPSRS